MSQYVIHIREINEVFRKHRLLKFFSIFLPDDHNFYVDYILKLHEIYNFEHIEDLISQLKRVESRELIRSSDYNLVNRCLIEIFPIIVEDVRRWLYEYMSEHPEVIERFESVVSECKSNLESIRIAYPYDPVYASELNKRAIAIVKFHVFVLNFFLEYNQPVDILAEFGIDPGVIESISPILCELSKTLFSVSINAPITAVRDITIQSITRTANVILSSIATIDAISLQSVISSYVAKTIESLTKTLPIVESILTKTIESLSLYCVIESVLTKTIKSLSLYCVIESILTKTIDSLTFYDIIEVSLSYWIESVTNVCEISIYELNTFIDVVEKTGSIVLEFPDLWLSLINRNLLIQLDFPNCWIDIVSRPISIDLSTPHLWTYVVSKQIEILLSVPDLWLYVVSIMHTIEISYSKHTVTLDKPIEIFASGNIVPVVSGYLFVVSIFDTNTETIPLHIDTLSLSLHTTIYSKSLVHEISLSAIRNIDTFDLSNMITTNIDKNFDSFDISLTFTFEIDRYYDTFDLDTHIEANILRTLYTFDLSNIVSLNVTRTIVSNDLLSIISCPVYRTIDYTNILNEISLSKSLNIESKRIDDTILAVYECELAWFSIKYPYRRLIVIESDIEIENAVVTFVFKDETAYKMSKGDVAFVAENNVTRYLHYRDRDYVNGVVVFHVLIPRIEAGITKLYVYYGAIEYDKDQSTYDVFEEIIPAYELIRYLSEDVTCARVYRYD